MIRIENLSASYGGVRVLENVNLFVPRGEVCAVIGPSGCGKSTLLKILAGIHRDYAGAALINGDKIDPFRQTIGFMPQNYGLLPWKTVRENILLGIKIKKKSRLPSDEETKFFERLGIASLMDRFPSELSGGQKQRVGLARAFLLYPDILLMDEPFSALDAITRENIQAIFLEISREFSITAIMVTHQAEEAVIIGDRIAVFSPMPGSVVKILKNPLARLQNPCKSEDFHMRCDELRTLLKL